MEIIAPMWASNTHQAGKLLLTCTVCRVSEGETTLHLHEHALIDSSSKKKMTMPFDFDLKFGFSLSPPTIYFEKQEERVKYEFKAESDLQACREILRGKLNQRGFHEQFKPKKKIGKGNFASVYLAEKL
jgi:hypothetical protein